MRYPPSISTLISKELRASHVEDLPSMEPHCCVVLAIGLLQMGPYFSLTIVHLGQPILHSYQSASDEQLRLYHEVLTSQVSA